VLVFAYVIVCLVVATLGINRRFGYVGALFMCLAMTPVVAFLVLWVTAPARKPVEAQPSPAPTRTVTVQTTTARKAL
jgi:hypothetical protein